MLMLAAMSIVKQVFILKKIKMNECNAMIKTKVMTDVISYQQDH